jgi:hypothetical protein
MEHSTMDGLEPQAGLRSISPPTAGTIAFIVSIVTLVWSRCEFESQQFAAR